MIDALKSIFQQAIAEANSRDSQAAEHGREVAVAALLVEMIQADRECHEQELDAARSALANVFALDAEEVERVFDAGRAGAHEATSLFEFTSMINRHFEHDEKVRIVEMLWRVAYADGRLEKHESHLMRRLAELLHIRHREYIAAKLSAESRASKADGAPGK